MFNQFWIWVKKEPAAIVLLFVVLISFIWQVTYRNRHFQECDSSGVYRLIYDFPRQALLYTAFSYPKGVLLSENAAEKIVSLPLVEKARQKFLSSYSHQDVKKSLKEANVFALLRFAYIEAVNILHLPFFLQAFFALPFSSTYSAGSGVLYGLVAGPHATYSEFMSRALVLTLLVFYLSVAGLYFICRSLRLGWVSSVFAALMMLFSLSLYSQGFSLGSSVWNVASAVLWLLITFGVSDNEKMLRRASWATAALVFFNYLLVFYWLAFLLGQVFSGTGEGKKIRSQIKRLLKSQVAAIIFTIVCGALFFQPGQGNRGSIGFATFFSDIYYIVLNFFAFYTGSQTLNAVQFAVGFLLIVGFLVLVFRKKPAVPERQVYIATIRFFFLLFVLSLAVGILGFAPTRHLLFLAPPIFIGSAMVLDGLPVHIPGWIAASLLMLLTAAGFLSIAVRHDQVLDLTASVVAPSGIRAIEVRDCSYQLIERKWPGGAVAEFADAANFKAGESYFYLSQTVPFSKAQKEWREGYNFEITVAQEQSKETWVYFMAFNSNFQRFPFTRPNNLYSAVFTINEISKK